jgi:hypothetical protein
MNKWHLDDLAIGDILTWIAAIILWLTKVIDLQIFILFVLLRFEITLHFK